MIVFLRCMSHLRVSKFSCSTRSSLCNIRELEMLLLLLLARQYMIDCSMRNANV